MAIFIREPGATGRIIPMPSVATAAAPWGDDVPFAAAAAAAPGPVGSASLGYALPQAEARRPGLLTAVGVASLTVGGLGAVWGVLAAFGAALLILVVRPSASTFHAVWAGALVLQVVANAALAVLLIVAGANVLFDRPRARRLHLTYALAKIPLVLILLVLSWPHGSIASAILSRGAVPAGSAAVMVPTLMWTALYLAYPVALLLIFRSGRVRDYYEPLLEA